MEIRCLCEHVSHFPEEPGQQTSHSYNARISEFHVRLGGGVYALRCPECTKAGHRAAELSSNIRVTQEAK